MTIPNPGSDEAIARGCLCPQIDNHHGEGVLGPHGEQLFWHNVDCPLHGIADETNEVGNWEWDCTGVTHL